MTYNPLIGLKTSKAINVGRDDIRLAPALDVIDKTQNVPRLQGVAPAMRAKHLEHFVDISKRSVATTMRSIDINNVGALNNFSLCHGVAGNGHILSIQPHLNNNKAIHDKVLNVARKGIELHSDQLSWPCGLPNNKQTLGLMMGLAGIGYFYLSLNNFSAPSPLFFHSKNS